MVLKSSCLFSYLSPARPEARYYCPYGPTTLMFHPVLDLIYFGTDTASKICMFLVLKT